MELDTFPGCCGIEVLHGFYDHHIRHDAIKTKITPKERLNYLERMIDDWDAALMATLVENQREKWGRLLHKLGFRVVRRFKNPNSNNTVYLYFRGPKRLRKR